MSKIGKNIKKIRGVKKLSQTAFSELFKLSRTTVGAYEEGRAEPKIETLIQIAKYFGVTLDALITKELTINEILQFDKFGEPFLGKQKKTNVSTAVSYLPIFSLGDLPAYFKHREDADYLALLDQFYLSSLDLIGKTVFKLSRDVKEYGLEEGALLIVSKNEQDATKLVLTKNEFVLTETEANEEEVFYIEKVITISSSKVQPITDRVKSLESKMDEMMRKFMEK